MTEIKTIADLEACTDISLLKEQRKAYTDVMDTYCAAYPVLEAIRKQVATDEDAAGLQCGEKVRGNAGV